MPTPKPNDKFTQQVEGLTAKLVESNTNKQTIRKPHNTNETSFKRYTNQQFSGKSHNINETFENN